MDRIKKPRHIDIGMDKLRTHPVTHDDIASDYIRDDTVIEHVKNLLSEVKARNPQITDTRINYFKTQSTTTSYLNTENKSPTSAPFNYKIEIGVGGLLTVMKNGQVPSSELVRYTSIVFHEERHVEQKASLFHQNNPEKWIVDMARHDIITRYFPGYYKMNYLKQASEADAEEYGIKRAAEYFDTHYLKDNKPMFDARSILLDYNKNLPQWYLEDNHELNSYEEMVDKLNFKKKTITSEVQDMPICTDGGIHQFVYDTFFTEPEFENYRQSYDYAPDGIEREKVLLQAILRMYTDAGEYNIPRQFPKCMKPECKAYLKAFQQAGKTDVIPSTSIDAIMKQENKHISYASRATDKFGDILAAAEALEHDNSTQLGS